MRKRNTLAEDISDDTLTLNNASYLEEEEYSVIVGKATTSTTMASSSSSRMQPMSISMGKDYDSSVQQRRENSHRRTMIAILITSLTLVFSWIVFGSRKATVAHQTTSICRSYNAAYFHGLAQQIESIPVDSWQSLCVTDIATNRSQCRCHNPFFAQRQNSSKTISVDQWMQILQMNTELVQNQNYSELMNFHHY